MHCCLRFLCLVFLKARVPSISEVRLQRPIRKAHESRRQIRVRLSHLCQLSEERIPLVKHRYFHPLKAFVRWGQEK